MLFASLPQLVDAGFGALASGDYRKAISLAKRIQRKKNTAAYEIAGRAYWALGQQDKAIEQMRKGTEVAPQIYIFWSYLGHYYSDMGNYDQAVECLMRGMFLKAPTGEFEYNLAVVKGRMDDPEGALMHLDQFNWQAGSLPLIGLHEAKAYWLSMLDRLDEALLECEKALSLIDGETSADLQARLHSTMGRAYWLRDRDHERARQGAERALFFRKSDSTASWLLRELDGQKSTTARKCFALIRGQWNEPIEGKEMGFYARYTLLAEDEEHVLKLVTPFEPKAAPGSLAIEDIRWEEGIADQPTGVYDAAEGYTFYTVAKAKKARLRLVRD